MKTTSHHLSPPSLSELATTLAPALSTNYAHSSITIAPCPDLTHPPFSLAAPGLSGNESAADIGGQPHLFPRPLLEKKYSLLDCAKTMHLPPEKGMLIGAGAGPFHIIGKNSELAPNLSWRDRYENVSNKTHYAQIDSITNDGTIAAVPIVRKSPSTDCALMMNLFGSNGDAGPVLKITATKRTGSQKSFPECLRSALAAAYGPLRQITLGGVFLIRKGKAFYHIMPDFPPEDQLPFEDRQQLNRWLTYHKFGAPMVCLSVFHSADPEALGLRMEHTHCFSPDGRDEGGHYHYDFLAGEDGAEEEVEYEAYFNTARTLYRIDQPEVTLKQDMHD